MSAPDYSGFDAYWIWDFGTRFGCLADLLAYLRGRGYGRGFTCDVFGETEDEDPRPYPLPLR